MVCYTKKRKGDGMYLYHYTYNAEEILQEGMRFGSELEDISYGYGTGPINGVLKTYKPTHLPDFIQRDQCVFFYPEAKYHTFGKEEIKVKTENLEQEKLYVADLRHAQQIWNDTIDASFREEEPEVPLDVSAKNYWASLIPLSVYQENPSIIKEPEVMYFGRISSEVIEFSTTLHPLSQQLFGLWDDAHHIKRTGLFHGDVYLTEKQYFSLEVHSNSPQFDVTSASGNISKEVLAMIEKKIPFKEKQITKDGTKMKVQYVL